MSADRGKCMCMGCGVSECTDAFCEWVILGLWILRDHSEGGNVYVTWMLGKVLPGPGHGITNYHSYSVSLLMGGESVSDIQCISEKNASISGCQRRRPLPDCVVYWFRSFCRGLDIAYIVLTCRLTAGGTKE